MGPRGIRQDILLSQSGNFMVMHSVGMGLIPVCSWHRAQQPPANSIEICQAVVEGFVME